MKLSKNNKPDYMLYSRRGALNFEKKDTASYRNKNKVAPGDLFFVQLSKKEQRVKVTRTVPRPSHGQI